MTHNTLLWAINVHILAIAGGMQEDCLSSMRRAGVLRRAVRPARWMCCRRWWCRVLGLIIATHLVAAYAIFCLARGLFGI
jgi:hypothetical protein